MGTFFLVKNYLILFMTLLKVIKFIRENIGITFYSLLQRWFFFTNHKDIGTLHLFLDVGTVNSMTLASYLETSLLWFDSPGREESSLPSEDNMQVPPYFPGVNSPLNVTPLTTIVGGEDYVGYLVARYLHTREGVGGSSVLSGPDDNSPSPNGNSNNPSFLKKCLVVGGFIAVYAIIIYFLNTTISPESVASCPSDLILEGKTSLPLEATLKDDVALPNDIVKNDNFWYKTTLIFVSGCMVFSAICLVLYCGGR